MVNFYFEAPLKLIIDKFHKESQQIRRKSNILSENIEKIQYLAAPLGPLHGTTVFTAPRLRTTGVDSKKTLSTSLAFYPQKFTKKQLSTLFLFWFSCYFI